MNIETGYVYGFGLTSHKAELIKIGMTNNVERRLAEMNGQLHATRMPGHLTLIQEFSYRTADSRQAYQVEQEAHRLAAEYRDSHGGEWFTLTVLDAQATVEHAARNLNIQITLTFDRAQNVARLAERAALAEQAALAKAADDAEDEARLDRCIAAINKSLAPLIAKECEAAKRQIQVEQENARIVAERWFFSYAAAGVITLWWVLAESHNWGGLVFVAMCWGLSWIFYDDVKVKPVDDDAANTRAAAKIKKIYAAMAERLVEDQQISLKKDQPNYTHIFKRAADHFAALSR